MSTKGPVRYGEGPDGGAWGGAFSSPFTIFLASREGHILSGKNLWYRCLIALLWFIPCCYSALTFWKRGGYVFLTLIFPTLCAILCNLLGDLNLWSMHLRCISSSITNLTKLHRAWSVPHADNCEVFFLSRINWRQFFRETEPLLTWYGQFKPFYWRKMKMHSIQQLFINVCI